MGLNKKRRAELSKRNADAKSLTPLPEWQGDWLYDLVFRDAQKSWAVILLMRQSRVAGFGNDFVIVEEYGESDDAQCAGNVLRAWTIDDQGVTELTLADHKIYISELNDGIYPFELIQFHIHRDRKHVVLGSIQGSRSGIGCVYSVEGEPHAAVLVHDLNYGMWRS